MLEQKDKAEDSEEEDPVDQLAKKRDAKAKAAN